MKVLYFVTLLVSVFSPAFSIKILSIVSAPSKSHFAIGNAISKSLHNAGHDVTVLSPFFVKQGDDARQIRYIKADGIEEDFKKGVMANPFDMKVNMFIRTIFMYLVGPKIVNMYMNHEVVKNLLNSNDKFDICIFEIFLVDSMLGIADHFDCKLITYSTFSSSNWVDTLTSNQSPMSYVPNPFLPYMDRMTFWERFHNTVYSLHEKLVYTLLHIPYQRHLYQKYFPNAKRTFDEMMKSSSIMFINDHVASSSARPYLPSVIEIGGIHIEPLKPLDGDIKALLDSSPEGVVVFSMGSNVKGIHWPIEKREAFIKAFGKLKVKVLWKYENDTLPGKPDNVMINPWIPQRDIVAHPNVKVFITHGGLLGTSEALVEGVPVLGFPVFGDQKMNMAKAVTRGYGLKIDVDDITEEAVFAALTELLENPMYRENAKIISARYSDRPMTAKESVVYWTEYVQRHNGAPHLRAAGMDLNFFEFHLIDVYLLLSAIGIFILYINYSVLKFILRRVFKKKSSKKVKKN